MSLTREEIAGAVARGYCTTANMHKELDADLVAGITNEVMALQSLSQEAVRDEALEEAAKCAENVYGGFTANIRTSEFEQELVRDAYGPWVLNAEIATAIRALKREPNAAAEVVAYGCEEETRGGKKCPHWCGYYHQCVVTIRYPDGSTAGYPHKSADPSYQVRPAPAAPNRKDWPTPTTANGPISRMPAPAAPDVASMVKRLRRAQGRYGDGLCGDAADLLAKLGQGWMLEPRELKLLIDYHDAKGCEAEAMGVDGSVRYHDKRRKHYESLLPPGASDD